MFLYPLTILKSLFVIGIFCSTIHVHGQLDDPFGGQSEEKPFVSMGELPEFKSFASEVPDDYKVTPILPVDLRSLMETRNRMFLVDTREQHEYDVSHIKGAKRVGYKNFTVEKVWMLDRNTTIIIYSTDGERCKDVAAYMRMMGFIDVRTITGSLIGWINAGYSVVDKEGHTTNQLFVTTKAEAKKLKKGKAVFEVD